jgi:hypothetical protein
MGDFNRTTREVPLSSINPEAYTAIREHLETYNLGPILDDYQICIETTSEKKKKGLFSLPGPKRIIETIILTPTWLVLAVKFNEPGAGVLSVKLVDMTATDWAQTPGYQFVQDTGIEISGAFTGQVGMHGSQRLTKFVGLGEEPAAHKFRALLDQAVHATRR